MNTVRLLGLEAWSWCDLGRKAFTDHGHLTGALKGACELSGESPSLGTLTSLQKPLHRTLD